MSLKDLPSIIAGTLTGAAVGLAIGVGVLLSWPLVWPAHPDATLRLVGGHLVGEASGRVDRVDPGSRSVSVSASVLRLRKTVFQITDDTVIVVRGRRGGIGDLADAPVRVSYELRGTSRVATAIEAGAPEAAPAAAFETSAAPADARETPAVIAPSAIVPAAAAPEPEPTTPMPSPPPPVVQERSEPSRGVASMVIRAPRRPAARPRANALPAAPAPGVPELAASGPASRPVVPGTSDSTDGTSAVEWLLGEARGR